MYCACNKPIYEASMDTLEQCAGFLLAERRRRHRSFKTVHTVALPADFNTSHNSTSKPNGTRATVVEERRRRSGQSNGTDVALLKAAVASSPLDDEDTSYIVSVCLDDSDEQWIV